MNREGHKNVTYFVGPEVEHTPAFSKKTLFVVGKQHVSQIEKLAMENKTPHIYMGANHSFSVDPNDATFYWRDTITALLDKGFWVTLDYPAHQHEQVLRMFTPGVWQCRTFVPLLSVRIPEVQTSSPNLTIKIDDVDFKATNPGVWCMHFHEVTDSNRFTDWAEYGNDEILDVVPAESAKTPAQVVNSIETKTDENLVLNVPEIGLDPDSPSQLKPDPNEIEKIVSPIIENPVAAAEAYAEGTTEDPLGKTSKKSKIKKTEV